MNDAGAVPLTADALLDISNQIRRWAGMMLHGHERPRDLREEMTRVVTTMDRWHFNWKQSMGMLQLPVGASKFSHSSNNLLAAIHLSTLTKGGASNLESVVAQSLSLALPEALRSAFINDCLHCVHGRKVKCKMPSPTSVSRYEIS